MADTNDPTSSSSTLEATTNSEHNTQQHSHTQSADNTSTQPQQSSNEDPALDTQLDRDLDAEINPTTNTNTDSMMMDGIDATRSSIAPAAGGEPNGLPNIPAVAEPRIPQKKDTSLREFLGKMDDYAPLIPDAVSDYYFTLAGLPPPPETDRRLARLLALSTQKFIADIAADAYQYSRIRSTNTTSNNPMTGLGGAAGFGMNLPQGSEGEGGGKGKKDAGKAAPLGGPRAGYGGGGGAGGQGRTVLTMEDLGMAVGEYGVNVKRGEFYR
ncbi:Transcription initiation factor TFIID subunit 10 [Fulvia fulva]|uniref:Transcription initiation factor TFIID subunit 10 n=1 Tax=Passalora fulva TaxID=5499 RepID=A0A9Q8PDS5_PASFU|nr:Transcription initiation factor TFIID subunit 10 [Fulvia fulva]KAK4618223.1 Transcription initiation factor TFIID subunit 10 [Fulvia fulva]KAK4618922.1 Transcription initiation factor TFIID subunit 10 [Fulvia fulva]UJO20595.1 Transcription initiation factor TFIID subunit 10 [Fulvia fulva]WPV18109.1 Transcription initiation factor TFIID subunit 10 [Fulvia fulva]WPV33254.1 Transcription initiation factor TFIID subunit 10 [Fulvia fulva]